MVRELVTNKDQLMLDLERQYIVTEGVRFITGETAHLIIFPARGRWAKVTSPAYKVMQQFTQPSSLLNAMNYAEEQGIAREVLLPFLESMVRSQILVNAGERAAVSPSAPQSRPRVAYFNVTSRCNLHCPTCYYNARHRSSTEAEISTEEAFLIIDRLVEAGVKGLIISGGEPLIRQDIAQILAHARVRCEKVVLLTNGTLISSELAESISQTVDGVQVSIDGPNHAVHDAIRGRGTFERTIKAVCRLRQAEVQNLRIVPTITGTNVESLPAMLALALELNVQLDMSMFIPVGRGSCNREQLAISADDLVRLFYKNIEELRKTGYPTKQLGRFDNKRALGVRTSCGAGQKLLSVDAKSDVYPCHSLHLPELRLGNLLQAPLAELLAQSPVVGLFRNADVDNKEGCQNCDVRYFCGGGCLAHAYSQRGRLLDRDPYCSFYKQIFQAVVWSVSDRLTNNEYMDIVRDVLLAAQHQHI
jgi:radical SAM protein with 4Fe4S-binding SPASM domain